MFWNRLIGAAVGAVGITLMPAVPPSHAVATCAYTDPCAFDIATEAGGASMNSNTGGRAVARGKINFTTVRNFAVTEVEVIDKCNAQGTGDGLGAYLLVQADFGNGAEYVQRFPTPFKDVDGCNNGGFSSPGISYAFESGKIRRVRVQILECDGSDGLPGDSDCFDNTFSAWKDNPHYP